MSETCNLGDCDGIAIVRHTAVHLDAPDRALTANLCSPCFTELLLWLAEKAGKVAEVRADLGLDGWTGDVQDAYCAPRD